MLDNDQPVEGYFLTTKEDLIFDVKGLTHPKGRVICFLRYIPADLLPTKFSFKNITERNIKGRQFYKVYSLRARYNILQEFFPQYLYYDENVDLLLQTVPNNSIKHIHHPIEFTRELQHSSNLDACQIDTLHFCSLLHKETGVDIGITGSLLVNAHTANSDIDVVVYGKENGLNVYGNLQKMHERSNLIRHYSRKELTNLQKDRGQDSLPQEDFVRIEKRKVLQGIFTGESGTPRDFYIRLVESRNRKNEFQKLTRLGEVTGAAWISDQQPIEDTYFTPARYLLSKLKIIEGVQAHPSNTNWQILAFRGRFCECARPGEKIRVRGILEYLNTTSPVLQIVPTESNHYILLNPT